MQPLAARVAASLAARGLAPDAAQRAVLGRLEDLRRRLLARDTLLARGLDLLPRRRTPVRGLYLWGGVGRGKTFLADEFFAELPLGAKRRVHFHHLMQEVHAGLRRHRNKPSPLERVAAGIVEQARVLVVDEFIVGDVADAMILATLLDALFRRGVTLVATSNLPPSGLYRGGLQCERFLPAIALIERHCRVMELDAGVDYRLRQLEGATLWFSPAGGGADALMAGAFARLAQGDGERNVRVQVEGRAIRARRAAKDVAWFEFRELCEGPRATADYIEIARRYGTVFLSGVPAMGADRDDSARRFVTLVDEFYDRGVKLVVSSEAGTPEGLYGGERLAFEFRRAASRLHAMRSRTYLSKPHKP